MTPTAVILEKYSCLLKSHWIAAHTPVQSAALCCKLSFSTAGGQRGLSASEDYKTLNYIYFLV